MQTRVLQPLLFLSLKLIDSVSLFLESIFIFSNSPYCDFLFLFASSPLRPLRGASRPWNIRHKIIVQKIHCAREQNSRLWHLTHFFEQFPPLFFLIMRFITPPASSVLKCWIGRARTQNYQARNKELQWRSLHKSYRNKNIPRWDQLPFVRRIQCYFHQETFSSFRDKERREEKINKKPGVMAGQRRSTHLRDTSV